MFEGTITINDREIPRTLLGTSPFIGAAQFGHRSRLYQLDLYDKPENILKILKKSYEIGIRGIQLIPYEPVVKAISEAVGEGYEFNVVGTVRQDCENEDIELLSGMGASAMILNDAAADSLNHDFLAEKLEDIRQTGAVAGLTTRRPFSTTKNLLESPILNLFDIYMVPVNKLGYLMDTDAFIAKERAEFRDIITKLNKTIIAMQTMAAGILTPGDAFDFLKTLDYVDLMTVGIASEAEAEESFDLLKNK